MTTLRVTITSASYDEPAEFLVANTPKVQRAIDHLRHMQEAYGDGSTETTETSDDPDTSEGDFIDWVIDDTSDGYHDDEIRATIEQEDR